MAVVVWAPTEKLAVRYYTPLRKAMGGSWTVQSNKRPMGWDEVSTASQRPSFDAAIAAARMRFLARLRLVGAEWKAMPFADLAELRQLVSPAL